MRYVLNSAVITTPGTYTYRLIDREEAKQWLSIGKWEATIAYPETCVAFGALFGDIPAPNRKQVRMKTGDEALIFRLTARMSDPELKGKLTPDFVLKNCEIGILKKVAIPSSSGQSLQPTIGELRAAVAEE